MSPAPGKITLTGPVTCPSCGRKITGRWVNCETAEQQCGACGHVFEGTWPGFSAEPKTVIISRPDGQEPGRGAA